MRKASPAGPEGQVMLSLRIHGKYRHLVRRIADDCGGTAATLWAWFEITVGWLRGPARPSGKG